MKRMTGQTTGSEWGRNDEDIFWSPSTCLPDWELRYRYAELRGRIDVRQWQWCLSDGEKCQKNHSASKLLFVIQSSEGAISSHSEYDLSCVSYTCTLEWFGLVLHYYRHVFAVPGIQRVTDNGHNVGMFTVHPHALSVWKVCCLDGGRAVRIEHA